MPDLSQHTFTTIHIVSLFGSKVVGNHANSAAPAEEVLEVLGTIKVTGSEGAVFDADIRHVPQKMHLFEPALAHFSHLGLV
ncbi:hypothetical protein PG991_007969 [Apiospora marii]|uniref:Uncharacterized protein n=1 Tax=Apiospora marii TaxID=335849 RepID=A0ABR1RUZ2_9PEZI